MHATLVREALRVQASALRAAHLRTFEFGVFSGRSLAPNGAQVRRLVSAGPSDRRRNKSYPAIHACDTDWRKAVALLAELKTKKSASLAAFNATIQVCARSRQASKALELLRDMEDCDIKPNVITCNSVINACGRAKQWRPALELLESMKGRGLQPDVVTLSAAIEAVDAASQYQIAMDIMMDARSRGFYAKAWSKENIVDLHDCSAAASRAIIGCLLQDLRSGERVCQDISIITGRGNHSSGGLAILPDEVRSFLLQTAGPAFTEVPRNPGKLVLADLDLREWLGRKDQTKSDLHL